MHCQQAQTGRSRIAAFSSLFHIAAAAMIVLAVAACARAAPPIAPSIPVATQVPSPVQGVPAYTLLGGGAIPQGSADVLSPTYYRGFPPLYNGDYEQALTTFIEAGQGATHSADARWIDSICYYTMAGEVFFQTGHLEQALAHFTSALQLYTQYSDWMLSVQFPPSIGPRLSVIPPVPWGQSQRRFRLGQFQEKYSFVRGRTGIATDPTTNQPYAYNQPFTVPMQVSELVRCTALAITRRGELLGPVAPHDRLMQDVLAMLSKRPGPPNHWSEVWIDLQLGAAYRAVGRPEQATASLMRSLVAAGEYDHPLTCVAMLELGKISLEKGDYKTAADRFAEASFSAFYFARPEVVEEALRYGALAYGLSNQPGPYPPLAAAAEWGRVHRVRTLQETLLIAAAEDNARLGRDAGNILSQARTASRRDMAQSVLGARFNFVTAQVAYQRQSNRSAEQALTAALAYEKKSSLRLFHMAMVDQFYREGEIRDQEGLDLFARVLREPSAVDWQIDPMESLATLIAPQEVYFEHWFEAALAHDDLKTAIEVSDRIRRRRFYSTLPLGGRLLSLRWLLDAPEATLRPATLLVRNDVLRRYPHFGELARQSQAIRAELKKLPVATEDRVQAAQVGKLTAELSRVGAAQEGLLLEMALARQPAELAFPPQRSVDEVQKQMRSGQAILGFLTGRRETYAYLITSDRMGAWKIASAEMVKKRLVAMYRAMGMYDQLHDVTGDQLKDQSWRAPAADVLKEILHGSRVDLGVGIRELVIVPDEFLWYVPFEMLQIGKANHTDALLSRMQIRYAPTLGLAVPDGRARRQAGPIGVVMGRLVPREPDEISAKALERLRRFSPNVFPLTHAPAPPSSLLAKRLDTLVVLDDIAAANEQVPYQFHPLRFDRGKPGGSLEDWFTLPLGGPEVVVLPGFHTPAESSLKRMSHTARAGDDLFLTLCGLMSTGTQTVLISRWRTGGHTCNDLIAEMLQELPNTTAADAWQRSVEVARQSVIDPALEPRVKLDKDGAELLAENPFFWAGYLMVDTGTDPRPAPKKAAH